MRIRSVVQRSVPFVAILGLLALAVARDAGGQIRPTRTRVPAQVAPAPVPARITAPRLDRRRVALPGVRFPSGGEVTYGRSVRFSTLVNPKGIASGDFNHDGREDLLVVSVQNQAGSGQTHSVRVHLGQGNFGFSTAVTHTVSQFPGNPRLADLDGDGYLDLTVFTRSADMSEHRLTVLMGKNDGTFDAAGAAHYVMGAYPRDVAAGDLDGDGDQDLVVSHANSHDLRVLLGNGDGSFVPGATYDLGGSLADVGIADLNGDGKPDVVVAKPTNNSATSAVVVLLGNGNGTLATGQSYPSGSLCKSLALGDIDGNGRPDVVVANNGGADVSVYRTQSNGTLSAAVAYPAPVNASSVALRDFTGDGKLDIVVGNGSNDARYIGILRGNGNGTFADTLFAPLGIGSAIVGDWNGDGRPDLASLDNSSAEVVLVPGPLDFVTYVPTGESPRVAVVADFNRDGKADVAAAGKRLRIHRGLGNGSFSDAYDTGLFQSTGLAAGDLTGDGILDLVTVFSGGTVMMHRGRGDGTFDDDVGRGGSGTPAQVEIADVDGDGDQDVVVLHGNPSGVSVRLNDGAGNLAAAITLALQWQPNAMALGRLDADNRLDLVVGGRTVENGVVTGSTVAVALGTGGGSFGSPTVVANPHYPTDIVVADLDRDGDQDIAFADGTDDAVQILTGAGNGTFSQGASVAAPDFPEDITVADLNRDGVLDLVTIGAFDKSLSAFIGVGNGTFRAAMRLPTGWRPSGVAVGDFNADGFGDLVVTTMTPGGFVGRAFDSVTVFLGRSAR